MAGRFHLPAILFSLTVALYAAFSVSAFTTVFRTTAAFAGAFAICTAARLRARTCILDAASIRREGIASNKRHRYYQCYDQ